MSPDPKVTHLTVRIKQETLDEFRELLDREERTVSQDLRLYVQRRLERARRESAKAAA